MDELQWMNVIRELGILATACGFFVWTSWLRENRLAARIEGLETFVSGQLLTVVANQAAGLEKCTSGLMASASAIQSLTVATQGLEQQTENLFAYMQGRPCIAPTNAKPAG